MAKPDVRVRIAFSDGPYVASPTWTNVTSYVRSINISRGRNDDWTNFDSGSATLVLDNRDRRFDPTYSAGPYYGNLQPRRQVWIDATTNGSTYYEIFRGFIDGWPVNITQAGYDSTVTISCYDVLGLIAQNTAPYDWADSYIRSLSPVRYIKCDDVVIASNPSSTVLTDYGSYATNVAYDNGPAVLQNVESVAPGLPYRGINLVYTCYYRSTNTLTNVSSVSAAVWTIPTPYLTSNQAFGPDFTVKNTAGNQVQAALSYVYNVGSSRYEFRLAVTVQTGATTSTIYQSYYYLALDNSQPHHLAFTLTNLTGTPTVVVYVDGIAITADANTSTAGSHTARDYFQLQLIQQQAVLFTTLLTATQVQTIYNLSLGQVVETTSARFSRIVAQTSIPGAFYSATASPAGTVAKINNGGEPINTALQLASDSEGGELYTSRSGVLTMTNRTYFESGNSKTNQATFGVGGIPIGTEISYAWNADNIRNALNITWSGDTTINVSDTASIAAYGTMQTNYDTQLSTVADVQSLGYYLVGFGKLPRLVMSAIEVGQAMSAANWNTVLQLELLDRITVVVDEPVGSDLTQVQLIQQLEHEITPGDWRVRILGSSRWTSYFILDTSTLDGTDLLG